jgi:hypothetical protein
MKSIDLLNEYTKSRNLQLNEDEFSLLVTLYPAVLVAASDHLFDDDEKEYIADVAANSSLELYENEVQAEKLAEILFNELLFLSQADNHWQEKFLLVLAEELDLADKDELKKILLETAEVSKGISSDERDEISRIMKIINH